MQSGQMREYLSKDVFVKRHVTSDTLLKLLKESTTANGKTLDGTEFYFIRKANPYRLYCIVNNKGGILLWKFMNSLEQQGIIKPTKVEVKGKEEANVSEGSDSTKDNTPSSKSN